MVLLLTVTGLVCANAALVVFACHVDPLTGRIGPAAWRRAWLAKLRSGLCARRLAGWRLMRDTITGQNVASGSARLLAATLDPAARHALRPHVIEVAHSVALNGRDGGTGV